VALAYGPFVGGSDGLEVFGGSDGKVAHRTSWKLNSGKTKWEQTGSAPADVLLGRAVRVGDSVLLFGGCPDAADLTRCSDAVWRRDGQSHWSRATTIPGGPVALSAIAVSGRTVFLFGGCSMPQGEKALNHKSAYRYDPSTNQWKGVRELPVASRGLSAVARGEYIYLFGGYTDAGFSSDVLSYDLKKDIYTRLNSMPIGLLGIEFVLNGKSIYGAGGENRIRGRSARLFEGKLTETAR
jgi:N-acetylneuraminic acid mutarotase